MADCRWGILGTGQMAVNFAHAIQQTAGAELAAVASRIETRAVDFSAAFDVKRAYGSYQELLEHGELDVVYVATPNHRHLRDSLEVLNAGIALVCEKPFAINADEVRQIVERARQANVFCMEAMWMNFMPLIRRIAEAIESGRIGTPRLMTADFGYPVPASDNNRYYNPELGGGALLDRGIYVVTLACVLLGIPSTISAQYTPSTTGVDQQTAIVLGTPNGALASLICTMEHRTENRAVIYGDKGTIEIEAPFFRPHRVSVLPPPQRPPSQQTLSIRNGVGPKVKSAIRTRLQQLVRRSGRWLVPFRRREVWSDFSCGNGYQHEVAEVVRCLNAGLTESPIMPLDQSLLIMEVMDRIREAWIESKEQSC